MTVRVIDGKNDGPRGPLTYRRIRHADESHVIANANGIKKTVADIRKIVKRGECIRKLVFHGHGRPGYLSIGDGTTYSTDSDKVVNGGPNTDELAALQDLLCKKSEAQRVDITLRGCCVGAWKEGRDKLVRIAKLFKSHDNKVCVMGATGPLRTDTPSHELADGTWKYWWQDLAVQGNQWQTAYSDEPPPDPLPRVGTRSDAKGMVNLANQPVEVSDLMQVLSTEIMTDAEAQAVWR